MRTVCGALLLGLAACGDDAKAPDGAFDWVVMADLHFIDANYTGPEGNPVDTENIYFAGDRFRSARDKIAALEVQPAFISIVGDIVHEWSSDDPAFYADPQNRPAIDIARDELALLPVPYHATTGNHDYTLPHVNRELTNQLFREKLGIEPYHSFDYGGFRFIYANSQLGATWDPEGDRYNRSFGSLGIEQLAWLDEQLQGADKAFVMLHYPLWSTMRDEDPSGPNPDLATVLERHKDKIAVTFTAHMHFWVDLGPEIIIGSTRYDDDAFFIVRCHPDGSFEILNRDKPHWMPDAEDWGLGTIDPL